jgi:xylulose-5-phosphate/fructose-6-phosphate phosphoketolase
MVAPLDSSIRSTQSRSTSSIGIARSTVVGAPLAASELLAMHRFWSAANYLAIGMIYLRDNPLLKQPLEPDNIKKRLLGHWGSSPGISFLYTHLNRIITRLDQELLYIIGPGHGAPGFLGPCYLEGSYSHYFPNCSDDEAGLKQFFKRFSFPGGIGSHCTPETPGSIHEGGELGYSLSHAFGAAFDNPN